MNEDYRTLFYKAYVSSKFTDVSPPSAESERYYFKQLIDRYFLFDYTDKILDLGCGDGALIHLLKQAGFNDCAGVEASPEQIELSKVKDSIVQGDLVSFVAHCQESRYDCVIMFDVMEHFKKDELFTLLQDVFRILKPNGRLIVHVPNAEGLFGARIRYGDYTHEQAFTRASMRQLLMTCGFAQAQSYEDQPVVHGLKSAIRGLGWKVLRMILAGCYAIETGERGKDLIFSQNFLTIATRG